MEQRPVCLTIGGSDSCGGAGIQADLRVFAELGVPGCSAVTALTAQNPLKISRVEAVSLAQLDAEIHAVFDYYDVAAVKTGMLLGAEHIAVVSEALAQRHAGKILIVDPVMLATSGRRLLDAGAVDTMLKALLPLATLITPNLDEAAVLLGRLVTDARKDSALLARQLQCAVLLKGGHASGDALLDVLCEADGSLTCVEHPRLAWNEVQSHGSGCRLASAIAAIMAKEETSLSEAVRQAVEVCITSV